MSWWALIALLAAGQVPTPRLQPGVTLTRAELRALSPEAVSRRLFGVGAEALYRLRPYRDEAERVGPLLELSFLSRPRPGGRIGICETDELYIPFEGVPGVAGSDPPARPTAVRQRTFYLVRGGSPGPDGPACAAMDPRGARLISAVSGRVFVAALDDLDGLISAAREGRAPAPLDCHDGRRRMARDHCLQRIARLQPADMLIIHDSCGPSRDAPACTVIDLAARNGTDAGQLVFERTATGAPPRRIQFRPLREIDPE